jgi:hypothetical protein
MSDLSSLSLSQFVFLSLPDGARKSVIRLLFVILSAALCLSPPYLRGRGESERGHRARCDLCHKLGREFSAHSTGSPLKLSAAIALEEKEEKNDERLLQLSFSPQSLVSLCFFSFPFLPFPSLFFSSLSISLLSPCLSLHLHIVQARKHPMQTPLPQMSERAHGRFHMPLVSL